MSLFLNSVLLPLLLVAAEAEPPLTQRYPQAIEVFHCNFDQSSDANFDGWPDGWTRRRLPGYPSYVKIKIQPILGDCPDFRGHHASMVGENGTVPLGQRQCLQVDLDGAGPRCSARLSK